MTKAKFHITIDDKKGSLNKENGISIDKIGDLLKGLYTAIDDGKKIKCSLSNVSGNCYRLDFTSKNIDHETNFIELHQNIKELNFDQLPNKLKDYARVLSGILNNEYCLIVFNSQKKQITTIKEINYRKKIESYYTYNTIYGYLSQVGDKTVSSTVKNISIDGYSRQIKVKDGEDIQLNPHYRKQKLRVRVKEKRTVNSDRVISAELIEFDVVNSGSLSQNLKKTANVKLNILKGKKSLDEVINALYGIAT